MSCPLGRALAPFALLSFALGSAAGQQPPVPPSSSWGEPLPGLVAADLALFEAGRAAFERELTAPEGLGPSFNEVSCAECHVDPVVGGFGSRRVTRFGRTRAKLDGARGAGDEFAFDELAELGGTLLQSQATNPACKELIPKGADVVAERVTPHLFGAGLIELIPDAELAALAAAQAAETERTGVHGRVHWTRPLGGGEQRAGRFGWKAQIAGLLDFSADASLEELGFTNRLLPDDNAPNGDLAKLTLYDRAPDPEDRPDAEGFALIDRVTHFQRLLAPPPQTPRAGLPGERVFESAGCATCHVREFTTPPHANPALSEVRFQPYSDFLLHDMGSLGDGIVQGAAGPREMRTMPLWGVGRRGFLMHDGHTANRPFDELIAQAVQRHDGEGARARAAFLELQPRERDQLVDFLRSLGRDAATDDTDRASSPSPQRSNP